MYENVKILFIKSYELSKKVCKKLKNFHYNFDKLKNSCYNTFIIAEYNTIQICKGGCELIIDKIMYQCTLCNNDKHEYYSQLAKNSDKLDYKKLKTVLNDYYDILIKNMNSANKNHELSVLLDCILISINDANLTDIQYERLHLWMMGMSEVEIADKFNVSSVTVHKSLMNSCKKISKKIKENVRKCF